MFLEVISLRDLGILKGHNQFEFLLEKFYNKEFYL